MKKIILTLLLTTFLSGCTAHILKAPCNNSGSNCWPRTKINQWNND